MDSSFLNTHRFDAFSMAYPNIFAHNIQLDFSQQQDFIWTFSFLRIIAVVDSPAVSSRTSQFHLHCAKVSTHVNKGFRVQLSISKFRHSCVGRDMSFCIQKRQVGRAKQCMWTALARRNLQHFTLAQAGEAPPQLSCALAAEGRAPSLTPTQKKVNFLP